MNWSYAKKELSKMLVKILAILGKAILISFTGNP